MGVAAASTGRTEVLIAGVAGLVAGAMSMAAGSMSPSKPRGGHGKTDPRPRSDELATQPQAELDELTGIYVLARPGRGWRARSPSN